MMPDYIRTKDVTVIGEMNAIMAAIALISKGVWFRMEPYLDENHWVITVKIEQRIDERGRPL